MCLVTRIEIRKKTLKRASAYGKRFYKPGRIEAIIGHLKSDIRPLNN